MPVLSRPHALNLAERLAGTRVEGPGSRFALWLQGCPLRCAGCCNPQLHDFVEAEWVGVDELFAEVAAAAAAAPLEGVSLLGGEPFAQAEACAALCRRLRERDLGVMVFSGLTLEELQAEPYPGCAALLAASDLLIDGRFDASLQSRARRWIGSDNQRVHFLSDRYRWLEDAWPTSDGAFELRLRGSRLSLNGEAQAIEWLRVRK
ncbi:MAG: 4Fe-4S single cluster domain-containing protein [Myxococcota bacterium]|jgi:anaerobic ribonucleoside-triphosphate reductase activating protein|nr:4Fe-4S single cluster domain-containing protein [Myxococcota bacterium]